jgi:hypothetical protein
MKHTLSKNLVLTGIAALLLAPVASADKGFSVGIAGVRATADYSDVGLDLADDTTGQRIFANYMFNDSFGIEAGFTDYGSPSKNSVPSDHEVEHESTDLYAIGNYSVTEKFALFGKAGLVSSRDSVEVNEKNVASNTSTDLSLAFGGEYDLFRRFAIRGEYQWLDGQGSGASDLVSVSAIFRFR